MGTGPVRNYDVRHVAALLLLICPLAVGCAQRSSAPASANGFQHEDPQVRINAVVAAGEARDRAAVPLIVDRLTDSESDVRFFAIMSLQKITGQTMGYRHFDPPQLRDQAVQRWRQYLLDGSAGGGSTQPAATQPMLTSRHEGQP
jgi:HEAT repeat protein